MSKLAIVFEYYLSDLHRFWPLIVALFVVSGVVGVLVRRFPLHDRPRMRWMIPRVTLALSVALGLVLAWRRRAIFDDAYISFRYAKNLLAGHGLVFNVGERVEGYTNFLWTVLVALGSLLLRVDIALVGFYGCLLCMIGNLVTVYLIGRHLSAPNKDQLHFPFAALWLGANFLFTSYGTSGMETMAASWLINLAVYFRVTRNGTCGAFWTGFFLILTTLTRPDHSLFYACMGLALVLEHLGSLWVAWRDHLARRAAFAAGLKEITAYCAPLLGYGVYLFWKWTYYGSLVPNTAYAKSANLTNWGQGAIYSLATALCAHLAILLPLFFWSLFRSDDRPNARFRWFALFSLVLYSLYVIRIGGDFMHGRFFVAVLPLLALGAERMLHELARGGLRLRWRGIVAAMLAMASLHGVPVIKPYAPDSPLLMTDPNTWYFARRISPLVIAPIGVKTNRVAHALLLKQGLADRGIYPVLATGGLGIIGYYSDLPCIDRRGLTDPVVARTPLYVRGRPGHEKLATQAYLDARQVRIMRQTVNKLTGRYAMFSLMGDRLVDLQYYRYDPVLIRQMTERTPKFRFTDFPTFLDRNIDEFTKASPREVADYLREFDHYYFSLNPDPERRARFTARFLQFMDFEDGRLPASAKAEGALSRPLVRPVADRDYYIDNYQGETLIASPKQLHRQGRLTLPPFVVQGDEIGFLLGGTAEENAVRVELRIDGKTVRRFTPRHPHRLSWVTWRVDRYRGHTAQLVLIDDSSTGRLLFDAFYEALLAPSAP